MKNAIVTGANGFVASYLIKELLSQNINVIAIVRNRNSVINLLDESNQNLNIVYCDLKEIKKLPGFLSEKTVDSFYHLAWAGTSGNDRANYELQLNNSKYSCDCAVVAKELQCKKFICIGTITEKFAENILNIDVKAENTIYGIAKHTTHCLLDVICKKLELPFIWVRLSNIYGSNNRTGNIVSYLIDELSNGKTPEFSKGIQPYDLMYVKDTAKALYLLGEKENKHNCYFVGSGQPHMLKDYLITIRDLFGKNAKIALGKRPEDGLIYNEKWFKTDNLREDTGFISSYTFKQGITETINDIKEASNGGE